MTDYTQAWNSGGEQEAYEFTADFNEAMEFGGKTELGIPGGSVRRWNATIAGVRFEDDSDSEDLDQLIEVLVSFHRRMGLIVGDTAARMEDLAYDTIADFARDIGMEYQTVCNYASYCRKVPVYRRWYVYDRIYKSGAEIKKHLTISHLEHLAPLTEDLQVSLMEQIITEGWSVRKLAKQIGVELPKPAPKTGDEKFDDYLNRIRWLSKSVGNVPRRYRRELAQELRRLADELDGA